MKQAFDAGDAAPTSARNTPVKNTSTTPKSVPLAAPGDDDEAATPTPKRKRATPKKKAINTDDEKFKPESDLEDDEDMLTPSKRAKVSKSKTKNQTKASDTVMKRNSPTTEATASINNEVDDDEVFHDAQEHTEGTEGIDDVQDDGKSCLQSYLPPTISSTVQPMADFPSLFFPVQRRILRRLFLPC
jgi:hypothetical protein